MSWLKGPRDRTFVRAPITPVTVALAAGASLLGPSIGPAALADPAPDRPAAHPAINWQPCRDRPAFDCGDIRVPLDHDRPGGRRITLAVIRHRATGDKIGSLFFNPGGPGGSGVASLPDVLDKFPERLRERFDLVSWDPRGVNESTAVQCFANKAAEGRFLAPVPTIPVGKRQIRLFASSRNQFAKHCARRNGALLRHVSTADSARDMDLLRRAVGERRLNYWGISYGTVLGATYVNLFPGRMRAITLDGNVQPAAWVDRSPRGRFLPTFMRQNSDRGAAVTLAAFLRQCARAGVDRCDFAASTVKATVAKFDSLVRAMRRHPLRERAGVTYSVLVDQTVNGLYFIEIWPQLAQFLQQVWTRTPLAATQALVARRYVGIEQATAILCGESPNPPVADLAAISAFGVRRSGVVAPYWAWASGACGAWRAAAADAYTGPWDRRTRRPVLLVGNTHDPATPLQSSRVMARQLARTRLLVVQGSGHTALLNPSTCANRRITRYFLTGKLPADGTRCAQQTRPFAAPEQ